MKKMLCIILLCSLLATVYGEEKETCHNQVCTNPDTKHCSARYGHLSQVTQKLQNYFNLHISSSFNYLVMATNFGGYVRNREGMEKVLRHLSDRTWEDAIDLIKYMNKRGIPVSFFPYTGDGKDPNTFNLNEIQSLSYALDSQKVIAHEAIKIHEQASELGKWYDPEVASHFENNFLHRHAGVIRNLAGLISDLSEFAKYPDIKSLSVFLFDEYLKTL